MSKSTAPNILVIDSDPRDRRLLRRILENAGYCVSECGTYLEAVEVIRNGNFDVIVLNLGPPGGSGFDVLEVAQSTRPKPRVIVTTGYPKPLSEQIFDSARKLGAAGAVDKEEAQESLASTVRSLLLESAEDIG